jgi:hypothetical protein
MDSEVDDLFIEVIWKNTWPLLISDLRSYNRGSLVLNTFADGWTVRFRS